MYGAIEAGGTKFVCGVGSGPDDLRTTQFATAEPEATVAEAIDWIRKQSAGKLQAAGIGSFGPLDLKTGHITSTPKAAWRGYDLAGAVRKGLGVPVRIDTDVNAAILGEAKWGAARDVANCLYLTVGTGIGGGVMVEKQIFHGLTHPEMGHIRIPHDVSTDPYEGNCPYHYDCLEGLASGPAIQRRWGVPGPDLPADHPAWLLEARYLALGLATFICTLSPERILIGGGVMRQSQLYGMINKEVIRILAGYVEKLPDIIPPQNGDLAGVIGALALAKT